jgi:hypothetical protein
VYILVLLKVTLHSNTALCHTCLHLQVRNRWTELSADEQLKITQLAYQHMKDGEGTAVLGVLGGGGSRGGGGRNELSEDEHKIMQLLHQHMKDQEAGQSSRGGGGGEGRPQGGGAADEQQKNTELSYLH